MAPTRSKKRKSTESTGSVEIQNFPAPPQMVPTKTRSPATTPMRSPIKKKKAGITMAQKQALIDNLQLEITERARKLRAQYMVQAQGLRTRIEIRVNRIPMALRRAKMADLYAKHSETAKPVAAMSRPANVHSPRKNLIQAEQSSRVSPSPQRGTKRFSDEICIDKENEDIENPKKRVRGPPIPPARTTSRIKGTQPSQVLSPRSANSRTLPRSPIRPASPTKSYLARPVSPLKPTAPVPFGGAAGILTNMVEKAKATRGASGKVTAELRPATAAGVGRGKRAAPPTSAPTVGRGRASILSESSESSNATIVRRPVPVKKAPVKKTVMGAIKQMGQKKVAATKAAAPATSVGGRVLRKRG